MEIHGLQKMTLLDYPGQSGLHRLFERLRFPLPLLS